MKKYLFVFTLVLFLASCNQSGVSKSTESEIGVIEKVIGNYTNGGVTRIFKADSTVETQSPFGNRIYTWKVIEENLNFIKIEETQGDVKSIFFLYENSTKYPIKISNCIKSSGASVLKNYTGEILISQYALESTDGCKGLYFKGGIE